MRRCPTEDWISPTADDHALSPHQSAAEPWFIAAALRRAGVNGSALRKVVNANADRFAQDLAPVVADLQSEGHVTLRALARALDDRGILTRRGGRWHVSTVRNLLTVIARLQ